MSGDKHTAISPNNFTNSRRFAWPGVHYPSVPKTESQKKGFATWVGAWTACHCVKLSRSYSHALHRFVATAMATQPRCSVDFLQLRSIWSITIDLNIILIWRRIHCTHVVEAQLRSAKLRTCLTICWIFNFPILIWHFIWAWDLVYENVVLCQELCSLRCFSTLAMFCDASQCYLTTLCLWENLISHRNCNMCINSF